LDNQTRTVIIPDATAEEVKALADMISRHRFNKAMRTRKGIVHTIRRALVIFGVPGCLFWIAFTFVQRMSALALFYVPGPYLIFLFWNLWWEDKHQRIAANAYLKSLSVRKNERSN
jgi:hypothetical protein